MIVNKSIIAESLEVTELNVTDDVYVNHNRYTPIGSILNYAGPTAPTGWLLCDGSEVSKTTYSRFFNSFS